MHTGMIDATGIVCYEHDTSAASSVSIVLVISYQVECTVWHLAHKYSWFDVTVKCETYTSVSAVRIHSVDRRVCAFVFPLLFLM